MWIPVLIILSFCVAFGILGRSLFAPSVFPGVLWSAYLSGPLLLLSDSVSQSTVWTIAGLVVATQIGAFLSEGSVTRAVTNVPSSEVKLCLSQRALRWSLAFTAFSLLGAFAYATWGLRRFNLEVSLEGFLNLGQLFYGVLLEGEDDPIWFRALRMWIFPAVMLSGAHCALGSSRRKKLLSLLAFAPALLVGATIASRFGTLMALCCWAGGFLAAKTYATCGSFRLGRKFSLGIAACLLLPVVTYVAFDIVRGHDYHEDVPEYWRLVRSNFFGYLPALDHWLHFDEPKRLTFGAYTLAGVFEALGLFVRERGLYHDVVTLEDGVPTNIYTAFRGLVQDFSLGGALPVCFVLGIVAGRAYRRVIRGRIGQIPVLTAYYSFLLLSPIISIFNYNAVLLALFVAVLALKAPREIPHRSFHSVAGRRMLK